MRRIFIAVLSVLFFVACSTQPNPKISKPGDAFFDKAVADGFVVGKTTRDEVERALGQPYPEPLKTPERWTYMYTRQKQVTFTFSKGVLTSRRWSEKYGIGGKRRSRPSAHGW